MQEITNYICFIRVSKEKDNKYWCINKGDPALYIINLDKYEAKRIISLPRSEKYRELLYKCLINTNQHVVALPQNCFDIVLYNKESEQIIKIPLGIENELSGYGAIDTFVNNNKVVIISAYNKTSAFELDLKKLTICKLDKWNEMVKKYVDKTARDVIYKINKYKSGIVFGLVNTDVIIYYDLKSNTYKEIAKLKGKKIREVSLYKEKLYISTTEKGEIIEYDLKENKISRSIEIQEVNNLRLTVSEEDYLAIPDKGTKVYIIKKENGTLIEVDCGRILDETKQIFNKEQQVFVWGEKNGDQYILLSNKTKGIISINTKTNIIKHNYIDWINSPPKIKELLDLWYEGFEDTNIFREEYPVLIDYIEYLKGL